MALSYYKWHIENATGNLSTLFDFADRVDASVEAEENLVVWNVELGEEQNLR
jgi:hypothetical protein